jgi:hypothetical protein
MTPLFVLNIPTVFEAQPKAAGELKYVIKYRMTGICFNSAILSHMTYVASNIISSKETKFTKGYPV